MDREEILKRIAAIRQTVNAVNIPNVYLLHGEFADNEKCGHGKVSWPSGSSYSGDWKHDMPNGTGILNAQGKIYIGQWTDGCANNDTIVIRRL